MHDILRGKTSLARVALLAPNCPWRHQYESIVIPKAQYEFMMQRVLSPRTAHHKILLSYLLWGGERFHDKSLLLPCHLIANFFGYPESSNVNTGTLLQNFKDDGLSQIPGAVFEFREHDWSEHKCRSVEVFHLGSLQAEFDALGRVNGRFIRAKDMPSGSMVHLHDGRVFSRRSAGRLRARCDASARAQVIMAHPVSQKVIDTMHRVPEAVFSRRVGECFDQAIALVEKIKDANVRRSQEAILRRIDVHPTPRYSHSLKDHTHRVFANGHIPNLKRGVRTIVTEPWLEADLSCAQLAIASATWEMEKGRSFLANGGDVWDELLTPVYGLSRAHRQEVKSAIKTAMYSMLYLMRVRKVRQNLQKQLLELNCKTPESEFLAHWIFRELAEASQIQARRLRDGHGLTDAFGQVHHAVDGRKPGSVMAQVNQSYELYLLEPVLDYVNAKDAKGTFLVDPKEMRIVLWSHDGFNIAVRRKDQIPRYQRMLSTLVKERAHATGIPTRLEWRKVEETPKEKRGRYI
jgi:hypothetical protein